MPSSSSAQPASPSSVTSDDSFLQELKAEAEAASRCEKERQEQMEKVRGFDADADNTTCTKADNDEATKAAGDDVASEAEEPDDDLAINMGEIMPQRCRRCHYEWDHQAEVSVTPLFPVPSRQEALMMVMGCKDVEIGELRSDEEVSTVLNRLLTVLNAANSSYEPVVLDFGSTTFRELIAVDGAVDFLLQSGWERRGSTVVFDRPAAERPCQRMVIGMCLVRRELRELRQGTRALTATPETRMSSLLQQFDVLQKKSQDEEYFPTFHDVVQWVDVRNGFYLLSLTANEDVAGSWFAYCHSSRQHLMETLQRVRSAHHTLRVWDTPSYYWTRDTKMLRAMMREEGLSLTHSASNTLMTPPTKTRLSHSSPQWLSPGDALLRTPENYAERLDYDVAQPPADQLSRDPDADRAGLLNIRQCCFVNSLVQVYFTMPQLPKLVMQYPRPEVLKGLLPADTPPPTNAKVVYRLQALFAYLEASSISCINPVKLLEAVADVHPQFGDGGQHDPHEFASCMMEAVQKAFVDLRKALPPDASPVQKKLFSPLRDDDGEPVTHAASLSELTAGLKEVLQGELVEETFNPDMNKSSKRSEDMFHFVPLYFNDDATASEHVVPAATDRRSAKHQDPMATCDLSVQKKQSDLTSKTSARVTLAEALCNTNVDTSCNVRSVLRCYDSLPSSLMFYLPARTETSSKKQPVPLEFPETIDMGRFSIQNVAARELRHDLLKAKAFKNQIQTAVDAKKAALKKVVALVESLEEAKMDRTEAVAIELVVRRELNNAENQLSDASRVAKSLIAEITRVEQSSKPSKSCDTKLADDKPTLDGTPTNKDVKEILNTDEFALHAIIVHVGNSTSAGHYYAYIRDRQRSSGNDFKWRVFDDTRVEDVDSSVVFSEETQKHVYCLSYIRRSVIEDEVAAGLPLPRRLRELVEAEDTRKQLKIAQRISMAAC